MRLLKILNLTIILVLFGAFQSSQPSKKVSKDIKQLEGELSELLNNSQYEAALTKRLEIISLYEQDKNWEKVINHLHENYSLASDISNFQDEVFLKKASNLSNEYLPKHHILKGESYYLLGEWYTINEKYDSAITELEKASSIFKQLEEWEDAAWGILTKGTNHFYKNELENMRLSIMEVESIAEREQLSSDIFDAVYGAYGVYYYATLNLKKSIYYNNRSLQLIEKKDNKLYEDSLAIADVYHNQGLNYIQYSNLQRAEFCFSKSISFFQSLGIPTNEIIDIYDSYSDVLYQLKQYDKSLEILEKLQKIKKEDFSDKVYLKNLDDIYHSFIENYFALSELDNASSYINELIKLYEDKPEIPSSVLLKKGRLFFYQKKYQEAKIFLQSITSKYEKERNDLTKDDIFRKYTIMPRTYNILGQTLYALGKNKEALLCFQKSLEANLSDFRDINDINQPTSIQNPFRTEHILTSLHQKAITLEALNTEKSKQQALSTYQLAIEWAEHTRQNMAFDASKEKLSTFADIYKNAVNLAAKLYKETNKQAYLAMAFEWSEKEKAVILLENLIDEKGKVITNVPEDLLEREANLKKNLTFFQQKKLELEDEKDGKNYQLNEQRLVEANLQLAKLKDTLQTYYQSYFNLEYQSSIATIPIVQKDLLQPQQALIQYFTTDSLFYVFIIDKENSQLVTLPKGANENQLLEDLQANLQQTNIGNQTEQENFQNFVHLAHQGYQSILAPITNRLSADVKELIIVPDAALNYLPFETLLSEAVTIQKINYLDLPYALNDYQFHYGYSGTLLLENQRKYQQLKTNDKILAFAPPYKSENQSEKILAQRGNMENLRSNVAQLKGTAKEIKAIANDFDGEFDFSASATKENFVKQIGDYGILHLAMHGKPSLDNPNNAHLVFSNLDNKTDKDNLLHHYEITALETKAQLAVLSACETGVGKELEGEGVMSLGRGFMYAGIPSVVMSLWKMNDETTSKLMPLFYKNLAKDMRKDKALHQAKLEYLDNAKYEEAHPFYWAGLISLGDAQPLKKGNTFFSMKNITWIVLGLFLLFFGVRLISNRRVSA